MERSSLSARLARPWPRRGAVAGAIVAALLVFTTAPAHAADVSRGAATAAGASLIGNPLLTTGEAEAVNTGAPPVVTDGTNTATLPGGLGSLLTLGAGALAQQARADSGGYSAACAGVIAGGGALQIGTGNDCTQTGGSGGVSLGVQGLITVSADALWSQCSAGPSNGPDPTGSAVVADASAAISLLGIPAVSVPLTYADAPDTTIDLGVNVPLVGPVNVATVVLNEHITNPDGSLTVNALHLTVLDGLGLQGADVVLGTSTCGPNALVDPVPVVSTAALPLVAVGAVIVVGAGVLSRRYGWLTRS